MLEILVPETPSNSPAELMYLYVWGLGFGVEGSGIRGHLLISPASCMPCWVQHRGTPRPGRRRPPHRKTLSLRSARKALNTV